MLPTNFWFIWSSGCRGEDFFLRYLPIGNKNCLQWPCLLTDQDEISNLYTGPSIVVSYQVSVHLAKQLQKRRLKCEKLMDRQTPSDGKSSHCLQQGDLKKILTGGASSLPSSIFSIVKSTDLVFLKSSITILNGICGNTDSTCLAYNIQ